MICYNCGAKLDEKDICPFCGADVSIHKKLSALSNRYYNDALEKASVRDLSGAIECLRQSLKLNKHNVKSRNLLGLVYYECGEIVLALGEWVISKNIKPEKNVADRYISDLQNNPGRLDNLNQTAKKFNIALKYCNGGNYDMAVIQLKKVLIMNPNFIRAHQLLSLLYINREDYSKAEKELQRCMKIDNGNTLTKRYLHEAQEMQVPTEDEARHISRIGASKENIITYKSGNETIIRPVDNFKPKGSVSAISIAVGAVLGLMVACFMILPARVAAVNSANTARITSISEESDAKSAKILEYETQISDLKTQSDSLQSEIDDYEGKEGTVDTMNYLMAAVNTYLTDPSDVESIAADMEHIDISGMGSSATSDFKQLYDTFTATVGTKLANLYYSQGYSQYKNKDYENAITNLSLAYQYDSTNGDALFYLGNCYYQSGDTDNAKKTYDKVIKEFPNTRKATDSETKIAEINNLDNKTSSSN